MKKIFCYILFVTSVLIIGSTKINAEEFNWEDYINDTPYCKEGNKCPISSYPIPVEDVIVNGDPYKYMDGILNWEDTDKYYVISNGGVTGKEEFFSNGTIGSTTLMKWNIDYANQILHQEYGMVVFYNVDNLKVKSSNENIITAETEPYDFSYEKNMFQKSVDDYDKLTLEEVNDFLKNENRHYDVKPTWSEMHGLNKEITTWWEAYGLSEEPVNGVIIKTYLKDLGVADLIISADNKEDIKVTWHIQMDCLTSNVEFAASFGYPMSIIKNKHSLMLEFINNLDKYKSNKAFYQTNGEYDIAYDMSDGEDLSDIINNLKGKDLSVKFNKHDNDSYTLLSSYVLNGKDIVREVKPGFTYDYNLTSESINKDKIEELMNSKDMLYIDFKYHGELPTSYKTKINVMDHVGVMIDKLLEEKYNCRSLSNDDEIDKCYDERNLEYNNYLQKYTASVYYYNEENNKMELVKDNVKITNGEIELEFDHFSTYALVFSLSKDNQAQTGVLNVMLYAIMTIGSLLGIVVLLKKKFN